MKVKVCNTLEDIDEFELEVSSIKEILSGLKLHRGREYTDYLLNNLYKYILIPKDLNDEPVYLVPETVLADMSGYDTLVIVPDTIGEVGAETVAGILFGTAAASAVAGGVVSGVVIASYIIAALVNIALAMALAAIMSLISPTKEFKSDPSKSQKLNSNLFNWTPLVTEAGTVVPLAFGYGFAGGVLISSYVTTADEI